MQQLNVFNHEEFVKNTYIVTENYSPTVRFTMGMVVGAERVLMINTGFGMAGFVRKYVEQIVGTEMPIFTICTGGQAENVGGAALFDEAYLKKEDVDMAVAAMKPDNRNPMFEKIVSGNEELIAYGQEHKTCGKSVAWKDLHDGDHFHLGGVHVGIFELPGVTPGNIAVRVTREGVTKSTFVGAAFSPGTNDLTAMSRKELLTYSDRLEDFMNVLEDYEPIYCSYSQLPMTKKAGLAIVRAAREIAAGKTDFDPIVGNDPNRRVHFNDCYGVLYDVNKASEK